MKDGKTVNSNGSEIIGLINLKYGKGYGLLGYFLYRKCGIFLRREKVKKNGVEISTCFGVINIINEWYTHYTL